MRQSIKIIFFSILVVCKTYSQNITPIKIHEWEANDLHQTAFLTFGGNMYFFEFNKTSTILFKENNDELQFLYKIEHDVIMQERIGLMPYGEDKYVIVFENELHIIGLLQGNLINKIPLNFNNIKFKNVPYFDNHTMIIADRDFYYLLNIETKNISKINFSKVDESKILNGKILKIFSNRLIAFDIKTQMEDLIIEDTNGLVNIVENRIDDSKNIFVLGKSKSWLLDEDFTITTFNCEITNTFSEIYYKNNKIFYIKRESISSPGYLKVINTIDCSLIFEHKFTETQFQSLSIYPFLSDNYIELHSSTTIGGGLYVYKYDIEKNELKSGFASSPLFFAGNCADKIFVTKNVTIPLSGYKIKLFTKDHQDVVEEIILDDKITNLNISPCFGNNNLMIYTKSINEKMYIIDLNMSTSVTDLEKQTLFYPTITQGDIIVNQKSEEIQLFELSGQCIQKFTNVNKGDILSLNASTGTHILRFKSNNSVTSNKVLIVK